MRYTWRPEKDRLNRNKHGLPLAAGIPALEDPDAKTWIDERMDYGEERLISVGMSPAGILIVATVEPDEDRTHIISVRKAERHEQVWYFAGRP